MPWRRGPGAVPLFSQKMVRKEIITAVLLTIITGFLSPSRSAQEVVDPHWTGKHCTECHVADKIPELRFDGDMVQLCNRCHGNDPPVCTKVHTKNSMLPDTMEKNIPVDWPLIDSKITCLTCHAVRLQMHANAVAERKNEKFLRSNERGDIFSFCFNCHQKERFQKTNPHQVIQSTEIRSSCFLCHTEDLASGSEDRFEASVKTKGPSLCIACHGNLAREHIAHVKLGADTLSANEAALHKLEQEGIELPLEDGRMHCATCHNPHPKGIIGRKEAAIGAGEKYFLRISSAHDLCLVCHTDESIEEYMQLFQQK